MDADEDNLNDVMEFDLVIEVREDGTVMHRPDIYAPCLYDDALDSDEWTMLGGYSGQDRYSGPVMHDSESIGGRMARDILAEPGVYVAIVAMWSPENEDSDDEDVETSMEGWAVARLNAAG